MPKLGTVTVDVWPRQQGATKNFYMDVVKAAMFDKKRVGVVVMNQYSESDIRNSIAGLLNVGGPIATNPSDLPQYGIHLMFSLPEPHWVLDELYVMIAGDDIDWSAIMNYARKRVNVNVVRIYDEENHRYV